MNRRGLVTGVDGFQHQARKRFGQNFLHDEHVIARIVKAITPAPNQHLIEIGPGQGAITAPLLALGKGLSVIEIDRDLAAHLRQRFGANPGFTLIERDVLEVDFAQFTTTPRSLRILGNLPYNISTPLLFHLLRYQALIHDMVFMLQREVVDRLAAQPGTADYGRLSVMMQYHCKVERLFNVRPSAFNPPPKVESAIVRLEPWPTPPHPVRDEKLFADLVREAFNQRRKTVRNALKQRVNAAQWQRSHLDPALRPENLSLGDYARITAIITGENGVEEQAKEQAKEHEERTDP
ncbi:MAG: 16S rRNA (adenine(1518)-N(6)/adenine(1519)-N(6))-dimethyltransferase RsmA [Pseudomonadales bacterium]|jgi:16S rRNA (adenine1518-N6/adenine1519-N6)-dimethyltransferase|nr:16S rRNA (adenine(1518)-N(6)/adenine(1519)-N(6))-dimethyltransferase RsmA [Pseudomonadales bacterium]